MVEFELKVHPEQHSTYLPRQVIKTFGNKLKMVPNSKAAIIYRDGTTLRDVLRSIEIITEDLRHRIEMEKQDAEKALGIKAKRRLDF